MLAPLREEDGAWKPILNQAVTETVQLVDRLREIVKEVDPGLELKCTRFNIGLPAWGSPSTHHLQASQEPPAARSEITRE